MINHLFWFNDSQWGRIDRLLPTNTLGMKRVDDRRVLSGIVHVLWSGGRWGDSPAAYGLKKTLYNRFVCWAERGIWEGIFFSTHLHRHFRQLVALMSLDPKPVDLAMPRNQCNPPG